MKDRCNEQIQSLNLSSICLQFLRFRIADVALMRVFLTVLGWLCVYCTHILFAHYVMEGKFRAPCSLREGSVRGSVI